MIIRENVTLAPHTTFNIGGAARYFASAETARDVEEALAFARERSLPVFVLGGGSNILISDSGFDGLVLASRIGGISEEEKDGSVLVSVGAGVVWDEFVVWAIEKGFAGLECLSGVPGTVGGAVVANLGAYGAQVSDTFVHAEVIDTHGDTTQVKIIPREQCDFSYHDSMFGHESGRYVILRATFALSTDPASQPSYRDNRFDMRKLTETLGRAPTQREVRESVLSMREEKGSLIMDGRVSFKCAGSFFHMPFVSEEKYAETVQKTRLLDSSKEERLRPWAWMQADGSYKVAPGFLLEYTEFQKGYVRGNAGISPRHTLSIINAGGAKAADIAGLARDMQECIEKIFGISLEREVEYVGSVENA